jgi:hypothetical protein
MFLGLSCVSSQGLWVLGDLQNKGVFFYRSWTDNESANLSQNLSLELENILRDAGSSLSQITHLVGVSGPGGFTGLRVTGSYLLGLSRALSVPVLGLPTFCLNPIQKPFWIPLQHQKVKNLNRVESLELGVEFLKIQSESEFIVGQPTENDTIWGLKDFPLWPKPLDFVEALRANLDRTDFRNFSLTYGSSPKIFGQRL